MRVVVNYDQCDANGLCASISPEIFELDDNDTLRVLVPNPPASQRQVAEEAARACPKLAITLLDEG